MAKKRGTAAEARRTGMPQQIDTGYYTVNQPLSGGGEVQVAELVVTADGPTMTENWFLYTSGAGIYKWPSVNNPNQQTRFLYRNGTTTVEDVIERLDQYGPEYTYLQCTCEQVN
jgi:hypothetical protein